MLNFLIIFRRGYDMFIESMCGYGGFLFAVI